MSNNKDNLYDSQENINILQKQIDISKNKAKTLLLINKGDIVKCVLDSYEFKEDGNSYYMDLKEDDPSRKCFELRQIMDEKDKLFTKIMENNRN